MTIPQFYLEKLIFNSYFSRMGIGIIVLIVLGSLTFLNHPLFGRHPRGERRNRIDQSPNFKNGEVQNLIETPQLTDGYTMGKVLYKFLFEKKKEVKPKQAIPSIPIDFKNIDYSKNAYYWLGHSSYLLILDGKLFVIDPVLTPNASPVLFANLAFKGTLFVDIDQIPTIDYLIITHDHYDHLDFTTIKKLRNHVKNVVCGLGVGSHFDRWGYDSSIITELDWWEEASLGNGITITATPVRHFSGRTFFHKNNTLFCSYVLQTSSNRIFIGGDSGYGPHFKQIGERFAPFDLIFLENGQYNSAWHYIHLHPEEIPLVIEDLKATEIMPVHHSKFALSDHPWTTPLENVTAFRSETVNIHTPQIGERVEFDSKHRNWESWWKN